MDETKPAVLSTGVQGAVVTITASIVGILVAKTHLPADVFTPVVAPLVGTLAGGLMSLLGRIYATSAIQGIFFKQK